MEERNKRVKTKAIRGTLIMELICIGIILATQVLDNGRVSITTLACLAISTVIICTFFNKFLMMAYDDDEKAKESEKYSRSVLSFESKVEVIPVRTKGYNNFILGITDIAKFYAVKKEDKIEISIKFNNEDQYRFFEKIEYEHFKFYYKLKEDRQS